MSVVYIPTPLRRLTGGQSKVNMPASDIADLLEQLEASYPGFKGRVCEGDGQVKRFINVFVNGEEIRTLQGLTTPLTDGDEVTIIPAMAGGVSEGGEAMATEEQIREALRVVVDPELGMSVIDLGLIRQIDLESDPPELSMILTTPFCPYAGAMVSQVQFVFEETLGRPGKVTLLDEMWDPSMMEGGDWGLW